MDVLATEYAQADPTYVVKTAVRLFVAVAPTLS